MSKLFWSKVFGGILSHSRDPPCLPHPPDHLSSDHFLWYRTTNPDTKLDDVLEQPFLFTARWMTYIDQYLQTGSSGAFAQVSSMSKLELLIPFEEPKDDDGDDNMGSPWALLLERTDDEER
jgi:hypothetical protein